MKIRLCDRLFGPVCGAAGYKQDHRGMPWKEIRMEEQRLEVVQSDEEGLCLDWRGCCLEAIAAALNARRIWKRSAASMARA